MVREKLARANASSHGAKSGPVFVAPVSLIKNLVVGKVEAQRVEHISGEKSLSIENNQKAKLNVVGLTGPTGTVSRHGTRDHRPKRWCLPQWQDSDSGAFGIQHRFGYWPSRSVTTKYHKAPQQASTHLSQQRVVLSAISFDENRNQ